MVRDLDVIIGRDAGPLKRFASEITGKTRIRIVKKAGHMADFDDPKEVARSVDSFLSA